MSDGAMMDFLPLLRTKTGDANAICAAGFGGVILDGSTPTITFARECQAQNLTVWLDVSTLAAPHEELKQQRLVFQELQPLFETDGDELDTLHPQSARVAIEILESFSEVLSGVLFDAAPRAASTPFPPFPWSPNLRISFQTRRGFDILSRIESLVSSGDEAARIRQLYWEEIHLAREENFLQPIRHWCAQNKIAFVARNFRAEWNAFSPSENLRARLDAAATTLDGARAFPVTLHEEENVAREFHALLRTGASAFARREYSGLDSAPQVLQNQIIARSADAFAKSRSAARVGVLFPARSAQTHYHPGGHRFTRWVGDDLKRVTDLLDDLHFDWLLVSEEQLASATRTESTLRVGESQHELQLIVVPSVTALSWAVWEKLEQFAESGGKVACLGLLPRWSERGRDRELEQRVNKTTRIVGEDLYQAYAALESETEMPPTIGYPIFREYHSGGRLCCYQPRLNDDADDARLRVRQILHESLPPVFETLAPEIRYAHRLKENGDLFFVANEGEYPQRVNARFRPQRDGAPVEFNAATGQEKSLFVAMPYSTDEGGGIGVSFDLAPAQARLIEIQNPKSKIQNSLERATFEVEFFDGQTATGLMTQTGTPQIALRRNGKIEWHTGEDVKIPSPILPDTDDWIQTTFDSGLEYSQSLSIPAEWENCRVFFEVAAKEIPVQCIVSSGAVELRIAPPFRFDVTLFLAVGASNDFMLKLWTPDAEEAPLTRLVAYPLVAVKITP